MSHSNIFGVLFWWWMMSWSPRIFASLSNKVTALDHRFPQNIEITFFLWGGMWTRRSLWNTQRRHNIWWIGDTRPAWWILSEQYFWRFIHWRRHEIRKVYLWRRVQVCSLWGKEEVWNNILIIPGSAIVTTHIEKTTQILTNRICNRLILSPLSRQKFPLRMVFIGF